MGTEKKIGVLIVDDSALFRGILSRGISFHPDLEVIGTATDPFDAQGKIAELLPDVMVCDVVMPRMDGIEFIRRLLPRYPIPVVVVSSVSEAVLDAMNAGAVDFAAKPDMTTGRTTAVFMSELVEKIRIASKANVSAAGTGAAKMGAAGGEAPARAKRLIAIGASTGGTEAIFNVLKGLPADTPGIVIVQHIPPIFSRMFAERLNNMAPQRVREAKSGDYIEDGLVLIAPGDRHMRVKKLGRRLRVELFEGEKVNGHCPSVDVLFHSAATVCGRDTVGVLLTGMGEDGARGMLAIRQSGGYTIGQDEPSSVVYGMPRAAYEMGGVEKQAHLGQIPREIMQALFS